jgi:hypothetical protein
MMSYAQDQSRASCAAYAFYHIVPSRCSHVGPKTLSVIPRDVIGVRCRAEWLQRANGSFIAIVCRYLIISPWAGRYAHGFDRTAI